MPLGTISPVAIQQFFDQNGDPLAGGLLSFFLAGTSTPTPAFADVTLAIPLANPVVLDAAGRAPQLFLDALTYKQVLQTAQGVTLWTADNLITPGALRSAWGQTSVTGLQHDLPIPPGIISFLDFRNTADVSVDGFAGGSPGQLLLVRAIGTGPVYLVDFSSSGSQPAHQLFNFTRTASTPLVPSSGSALYVYGSRGVGLEAVWILISHEQGNWLRIPYDPARFVAWPSGSWVVDPGDIKSLDIRLSGTCLQLTIALEGTAVSGAPTHLQVTNWPFTFKTGVNFLPAVSNAAAGNFEPGAVGATAGSNVVHFNRPQYAPYPDAATLVTYAQIALDVA